MRIEGGLGLAACLMLASVASGDSVPSLSEMVSRFEDLRVGAASAPVADLPLSSGHMSLLLRSGRASAVRAGADVVGLFFEGSGALEYRSVDPVEFPVLAFNLRKGPGLSLERGEKSATVRDRFERLLWLAPEALRPRTPPEDGPSMAAAFARHREKFGRIRGAYDNIVRRWKAAAAQAGDAAPIPLANRVTIPSDYFTAYTIRTGLLYSKGAYLLSVLHRELGDETFLTFLKSYQKSFRWKFGSTATVAGLLEWLTHKSYAPFFEANYWGTGMPK
jgi:hypothetical protein